MPLPARLPVEQSMHSFSYSVAHLFNRTVRPHAVVVGDAAVREDESDDDQQLDDGSRRRSRLGGEAHDIT